MLWDVKRPGEARWPILGRFLERQEYVVSEPGWCRSFRVQAGGNPDE